MIQPDGSYACLTLRLAGSRCREQHQPENIDVTGRASRSPSHIRTPGLVAIPSKYDNITSSELVFQVKAVQATSTLT